MAIISATYHLHVSVVYGNRLFLLKWCNLIVVTVACYIDLAEAIASMIFHS